MRNNLKKVLTYFIILLLVSINISSSARTPLFNMSYLYFGQPNTYINQVNATKGSLNMVSPNYFDITVAGELEITWRLQRSFIQEMHRRGMKVVPFLSNHWNLQAGINGLQNRERLARDIAKAIEEYNLDGVNVDIEGVGHAYRNAHTDLVRRLREYIPKHKEVSVAVAANPNNWQTGWHGFYDYQALATHADYIMIMAYDESWDSPVSPIGPVASISFSERSIQYALHQKVPRNKIVYGIPFYGRMWKLDGPTLENRRIHGMGLSSTRVLPLVEQFKGKVHFDEQTKSPYATFTIPIGAHAFVGATKLTEGNYVIWYENEKSIKAKLRLPRAYNIKGTGSWALMHETPDTWDYYSLWLNGRYFNDVRAGHWAESSIISVADRGWMGGTTENSFSPDTPLTRAQAAVIIVRALGYSNVSPKNYLFTDTVGHWARREIEIAREQGFVGGIGHNKYAPNSPLTREQLANILFNIFQYNYHFTSRSPFPDLASNRWSYRPILAIYQNGKIGGFEDGTFRPSQSSTRAQMAVLMERMADDFIKMRR